MRSDQVHPNVINYNLAVKALAKGGQWEQAVNILEDMERRGVSPDARTYSAAIEVCTNAVHGRCLEDCQVTGS